MNEQTTEKARQVVVDMDGFEYAPHDEGDAIVSRFRSEEEES